jgi:hypothetical protein
VRDATCFHCELTGVVSLLCFTRYPVENNIPEMRLVETRLERDILDREARFVHLFYPLALTPNLENAIYPLFAKVELFHQGNDVYPAASVVPDTVYCF